jgi:hypothetical protein
VNHSLRVTGSGKINDNRDCRVLKPVKGGMWEQLSEHYKEVNINNRIRWAEMFLSLVALPCTLVGAKPVPGSEFYDCWRLLGDHYISEQFAIVPFQTIVPGYSNFHNAWTVYSPRQPYESLGRVRLTKEEFARICIIHSKITGKFKNRMASSFQKQTNSLGKTIPLLDTQEKQLKDLYISFDLFQWNDFTMVAKSELIHLYFNHQKLIANGDGISAKKSLKTINSFMVESKNRIINNKDDLNTLSEAFRSEGYVSGSFMVCVPPMNIYVTLDSIQGKCSIYCPLHEDGAGHNASAYVYTTKNGNKKIRCAGCGEGAIIVVKKKPDNMDLSLICGDNITFINKPFLDYTDLLPKCAPEDILHPHFIIMKSDTGSAKTESLRVIIKKRMPSGFYF